MLKQVVAPVGGMVQRLHFRQRLEGLFGGQRSRKEFDGSVILCLERYQKLHWHFIKYDGKSMARVRTLPGRDGIPTG